MNDLERDIRDLLDEEVRSAPAPHERTGALRKTRRRQGAVIFGGGVVAVALVAGSFAGLRLIDQADDKADDPTFVDQPIVTTSINGITMSHPEGWYVVDPDEAGLNGSDPAPDLPKLILAVAPFDPGELFACPGMTQGTPHPFLMTIQEEPRALNGPPSSPWPVEFEPLDVDAAESGCYPDWEFLRAGWTTAGRTFEARAGFAPDVSDADREALLDAFASMTFEPAVDGAMSVVLATGSAGGEDWELIASGGPDGLELSLQGESLGTGIGGFVPSGDRIQMAGQVFGTGSAAERVMFGPVSKDAFRLGLQVSGGEPVALPAPEILDVPDTISPDLNAFVFTIHIDQTAVVTAFDDANSRIASGEVSPGPDGEGGTPLPNVPDVQPQHGGRYWGLYLAVGESAGDPQIERAIQDAESLGYAPTVGDIACDQGAAEMLGTTPVVTSRVAVYFTSRADAMAAFRYAHERLGIEPTGIARVTTFCLD